MPARPPGRTALFLRARPVWWISFAVLVATGSVWALASPLLSVPDEPAHAIKAAAVWRGAIRGQHIDLPPGDPAGSSVVLDRVPTAYVELGEVPVCFKGKPAVTADCTPAIHNGGEVVLTGSPAGIYPPLFYMAAGWTTRVLDTRHALYGMRFVSVVIGSALLASALASARALGRTRLAVLGITAALTPMALFLIGSVNPNGLEIAGAIATGVVMLDVLRRPGRLPTRLLVRATVVGSCFVAARPLSPLFFTLVMGLVTFAGLTRPRTVELLSDARSRIAGGILAVVAVVSGLLVVLDPPPLGGAPRPDLPFRHALRMTWELVPFHARQMVGLFGWLDTAPPEWLWRSWIAVVAVMVVLALALDTTVRRRVALVGAVVAAVGVPIVIQSAQARTIGLYWQGRYSIPLAVMVPILAAWMIADSPGAASRIGGRVGTIGVVLVAVGAGLAQIYAWSFALSRYVVGEPTGAFSFLQGDGWRPPLGTTALFALALLAFIAYAGWTVVLATVGADEVAPEPAGPEPEVSTTATPEVTATNR